ncbi:MAG: FliG C-terminal domain-containing protein [Planctomycetota bacterium]
MAFTGKQKAAMLLMSMDAGTAAELLKGLPPDEVQQIALELARIDVSGQRDSKEEEKIAREFWNSLQKKQSQGFSIKGFLNEMLISLIGKDKAEQIQSQIRKITAKSDPFIAIRSASTDELVLALEGQHSQTIAVILSELPPKKSQEVLSLLDEEDRLKAVCKMTNPELLGGVVRQRIASMVSERLKAFEGETLAKRPEKREQTLRNLAITLSGLEKDLQDRLLDEISKHDEETSTTVRHLMVTWDDIPTIADRFLQETLRSAEPSKLALALYEADEEIAQKIRSNISERAAAMMQEPLEKEIHDAREEIVKPLRDANEEGTLRRVKS